METNIIQEQLARIEELLTQTLIQKTVLNIGEVAILTGYSKKYLYKLTSKNKIPHYKPHGKIIYFNRDELEKWMLRNRQATNDELEQEAISYSVNKIKPSI